jgi:uncharacterized membrane protein (DUF485 family)
MEKIPKEMFAFFMTLLFFLLFMINIEIIHAESPDIVGPDVIYKDKDRILTQSIILDLYSSDLGDLEFTDDQYTGYGDVPGIYSMTLGVIDGVAEKEIEINVRQTIGSVIAVTKTGSDYTIHMHKNNVLTSNDIITVLENVQMITVTSTTEISILTNTYEDNSTAPGIYTFEFHLATTSGIEETYEIGIKVNTTEQLLPDMVIEDDSIDWAGLIKTLGSGALVVMAIVATATYVWKKNKKGKKVYR